MNLREPATRHSRAHPQRNARLHVAAWIGATLLAVVVPCAPAEGKAVRLRLPDSMPAGQRASLLAAAGQGAGALRRYVWRTRIIYNYYLPDLVDGPG